MSIATQITRLTTLRDNIRTKLIALGLISNSSATLNDCYTAINGITAKAAATYNTSSSDQTVAAGVYTKGVQTIKAVKTAGISSDYILSGHTITVGDANSATRIANVTGTYVPYLEFSSKTVSASDWISSNEYSGYMFEASISCTGVTIDMFPYVEFSSTDASAGRLCNKAKSTNGYVKIYSTEMMNVTILKITAYKRS